MQSIFHSAFLQALGYAIANSLWQMALIWIVFWLLNIITKPGAANKYRIAVANQITGFVWFIVTLQFYFIKCSDTLQSNPAVKQSANFTFVVPDPVNSFSSIILKSIIKVEQMLPFLSFAYLFLLLILLTRWVINYQSTKCIRNKGLVDIDERWETFIKKVASQLGITKRITIHISELISSPLTAGFLKPIILIPVASINHLSIQQLEAVIMHELAHIKRCDYLLNLFLSVIEIILFFNPFTRSIGRHIKRERENSCDDWVLQFQYNPAMYAEALLQIASLSNDAHLTLTMNAARKNGELLPRIKRMIGNGENRFSYSHQLLSLLFITGILSSIAWFHPAANYQKKVSISAKSIQQVIVEPMAAKIENPLFNPVFFLHKPLKEEVEKSIKIAAESLASSSTAIKLADKAISTSIPIAMKEVENINFEKLGKDVEKSLSSIDFKKLKTLNIQFDTIALKRNMQKAFDENVPKQFEKITAEIKKAKISIEKGLHDKEMVAWNQSKMQEELNHALAALKDLDIPFIGKIQEQIQLNKKQLIHLKIKLDSIRSENSQEDEVNEQIFFVNVADKLTSPQNNAAGTIKRMDLIHKKNKLVSVNRHQPKQEDIVITYTEN
jgi:beta-lactamase regulating signal transducer with metallopeptidase domain